MQRERDAVGKADSQWLAAPDPPALAPSPIQAMNHRTLTLGNFARALK